MRRASNREFACSLIPALVGLQFLWLWVMQPTPAVTWRFVIGMFGLLVSMIWVGTIVWRDRAR